MKPDRHIEPDKFQQAWQATSSQTHVSITTDLLHTEVQRNEREFRAMIFLRDFREVVVSVAMLPVWLIMGYMLALPWTWYLTIPAMLFVAAFMLVYRARHALPPSEPGEPLVECAKRSLIEVDDQIWLLRNVFWWYLLPPSLTISAFFIQTSWQFAVATNQWIAGLAFGVLFLGFLFVVYYAVYRANQRAVRMKLEPRRQELLTLLASLSDETTGEVPGEYPILRSATTGLDTCINSPRRSIVAAFAGVAILAVGVYAILYFVKHRGEWIDAGSEGEYPKRAPYAAIRWQGANPEVELDGQWYRVFAINYVPTSDIVAFSQKTYGNLWQKRFEEDLVEILSRMGHPPKDTVQLIVQTLSFPPETRTLNDVPMTEENRKAIRKAAQSRANL